MSLFCLLDQQFFLLNLNICLSFHQSGLLNRKICLLICSTKLNHFSSILSLHKIGLRLGNGKSNLGCIGINIGGKGLSLITKSGIVGIVFTKQKLNSLLKSFLHHGNISFGVFSSSYSTCFILFFKVNFQSCHDLVKTAFTVNLTFGKKTNG